MPQRPTLTGIAPLPLPNASGSLPIFQILSANLGRHTSLLVSVCEKNTGKGKVELKNYVKRRRMVQPTTVSSATPSPSSAATFERSEPEKRLIHHKRRWLLGLHRSEDNVSLSVNIRDTEHGTVNMKLYPSKGINMCIHFKRFTTLPSVKNDMFMASRIRNLFMFFPSCVTKGGSSCTGEPRLHHQLEYKRNERSVSTLYSFEAFQHIVSVRVRNNPLRVTPKIQVPLWKGGEIAPCLIWEREPKSGPGVIQLMRKPFKISFEVQQRRVGVHHLSKSGSTTNLQFDAQSVHLEQTMTRIFKGALATITSTLSSRAHSSGIVVSVTAPWGNFAAHGSPPNTFSISSDAIFFCSQRRQLRAVIEVQNLSQFAIRLGAFY